MINISHCVTTTEKQQIDESHCHNAFEIIYCLAAGKNRITIEGEHFIMRAWRLYLSKERQYHFVVPDVSSPYYRFVLNFAAEDCDLPPEDLAKVFSSPVKSAHHQSDITSLFEALEIEKHSPSPRREIMRRALLNQLLYKIAELKADESGEISPLVSRTVAYINKNLNGDLSLDRIADELFSDKFYLCHLFREVMGTSISQYVQRKRIITAQNLIRLGVRPMQAAERVGFSDYSTFYRAYQKIVGKSPASEKPLKK
jgi:AraC-like DNA-binding protein